MKRKFRIIDLDNCISDDGWRQRDIKWDEKDIFKRYHDYHLLSMFDEAKNRHVLSPEYRLFIFTARPKFYEPVTFEWLKRNHIYVEGVFFRPNDCELGSVGLKKCMLKYMKLTPEMVDCCYDDRPDVVDMYRSRGFNAEHIYINKGELHEGDNRPDLISDGKDLQGAEQKVQGKLQISRQIIGFDVPKGSNP